ncbi:MAG: ABC transporter ATP-binding protein [Clostridia bacterium]|nr:ABC transporter ATP-binding protein [Clostridia bacterium]
MIKFENVSFGYDDKKIVENFSIEIPSGDRVCFFGKSGCGKSTLLRLIMGLETPNGGSVEKLSDNISAVFQEDRLLPFKTVLENITMFAPCDRAKEILARLSMTDAQNLYPSELSGGMARRAAIARALAAESDIYIFDEPFNGLDRENIADAALLINEYTKGKTLVLVTHEKELANALGCRIIEL